MQQHPQLAHYLQRVASIYDIEQVIQQPVDVERVAAYYTHNQRGYALLHSLRGAVHMALSSDGSFRHENYQAQADFIQRCWQHKTHQKVLEIASGKGFNTLYLAQRQPATEFTGIDITPVHVAIAQGKATALGLNNAKFELGDFHALDFEESGFDGAFEVEGLGYSLDLRQSLASIHRVLRPGADFIVFDCFRKRCADLTPDENLATQLIEKSMLVNFAPLDEFISMAGTVGFTVVEMADLSQAVLPNLLRFERMAQLFFTVPLGGKIIKRLFPYVAQNAIAGLLMPMASQAQILPYYRITLRRE